ncbi:MAG: hypothetical protein WD065_01910, partial [Planctomycetaceae bacterium]
MKYQTARMETKFKCTGCNGKKQNSGRFFAFGFSVLNSLLKNGFHHNPQREQGLAFQVVCYVEQLPHRRFGLRSGQPAKQQKFSRVRVFRTTNIFFLCLPRRF